MRKSRLKICGTGKRAFMWQTHLLLNSVGQMRLARLPQKRRQRDFRREFQNIFVTVPRITKCFPETFPCLLPYISQCKLKPSKYQPWRGKFLPSPIYSFVCLFVCLREMHEVGIINWILVRVSCPLFHISDSSATNYTMGVFFPTISVKAMKTISKGHNYITCAS